MQIYKEYYTARCVTSARGEPCFLYYRSQAKKGVYQMRFAFGRHPTFFSSAAKRRHFASQKMQKQGVPTVKKPICGFLRGSVSNVEFEREPLRKTYCSKTYCNFNFPSADIRKSCWIFFAAGRSRWSLCRTGRYCCQDR